MARGEEEGDAHVAVNMRDDTVRIALKSVTMEMLHYTPVHRLTDLVDQLYMASRDAIAHDLKALVYREVPRLYPVGMFNGPGEAVPRADDVPEPPRQMMDMYALDRQYREAYKQMNWKPTWGGGVGVLTDQAKAGWREALPPLAPTD